MCPGQAGEAGVLGRMRSALMGGLGWLTAGRKRRGLFASMQGVLLLPPALGPPLAHHSILSSHSNFYFVRLPSLRVPWADGNRPGIIKDPCAAQTCPRRGSRLRLTQSLAGAPRRPLATAEWLPRRVGWSPRSALRRHLATHAVWRRGPAPRPSVGAKPNNDARQQEHCWHRVSRVRREPVSVPGNSL